jgi:hypothetical protein
MPSQHKPDEIIGMLCETTIVLAQGGAIAVACGRFRVTEQSCCRWRNECCGLKVDQTQC